MYVDYSVGFGGAVKSLALTLRALPMVEDFIFTAQDPDIIDTWFRGRRVLRFRRLVNYRTTARVQNRASRKSVRIAVSKMMAAADLAVTAKNFFRLAFFMRRKKIDIVHLNNGFLPTEALLAARAARVPCIVHLRDFDRDPRRLRFVAGVVTKVITVSDAVGASLDDSPIPASARVTIHDPVDLELMAKSQHGRERVRASAGLTNDDIAVGIFGRVIPWKGQLEFVRALAMAINADNRIRAVIVGDESDGDEAYFQQVRDAIATSRVSDRFVLTGYRKNVEEYYAAVDIVVHASVTPEPFGMVVPEAMAAGRPVVAMDSGGPREVIEDGIDGLLVAVGDAAALSRAVLRLAGDDGLRARIGAAARKKAGRFGIASQAARVATVYRDVVASARQK
jgi:glycosyltransferase involved in cell wall biosynthesis